MNNNDILRRIRYAFNLSDSQMIALCLLGGYPTTRAEISNWLKKNEDPDFSPISDKQMAYFLNGFIIEKRGKKEGEEPIAEEQLSNNIIFRKLKIALALKDEDIVNLMNEIDFRVSKHEISAFFRHPSQEKYRDCKDQMLRNFISGLQHKFRVEDNKK